MILITPPRYQRAQQQEPWKNQVKTHLHLKLKLDHLI
ncbi:hypothetical protein C5167_033691 [Papaver somniferum]|uniref:Uncharacterized protein n=1 Tax=Papaver somniferum TaxID=3469 RepID=A0A4Y7KEV9_PAPSO|nr:hypothetical protein C5167_033691 [Papaver somniferum]